MWYDHDADPGELSTWPTIGPARGALRDIYERMQAYEAESFIPSAPRRAERPFGPILPSRPVGNQVNIIRAPNGCADLDNIGPWTEKRLSSAL